MPYVIYFICINLISVAVCITDKRKAIKGSRRVSEKTLFALCFLGGSVGMYLTMKAIRHKTLHKRFMIGIPLIIFFQIAIVIISFIPNIGIW